MNAMPQSQRWQSLSPLEKQVKWLSFRQLKISSPKKLAPSLITTITQITPPLLPPNLLYIPHQV
jgi:hypothetical protein